MPYYNQIIRELKTNSTNNKLIIQPVGFFRIFQKMCQMKKKTELIGFNHNDAEEFLQFFFAL